MRGGRRPLGLEAVTSCASRGGLVEKKPAYPSVIEGLAGCSCFLFHTPSPLAMLRNSIGEGDRVFKRPRLAKIRHSRSLRRLSVSRASEYKQSKAGANPRYLPYSSRGGLVFRSLKLGAAKARDQSFVPQNKSRQGLEGGTSSLPNPGGVAL